MRISDWSSDVCSSDLKDSFVANRVTTLKLGAFFSVGGARVTTLKTAVWADDVTHGVRATTLRFGVYADDHTHGVRATTLSVGGWASLDQGLYLQSTDNAPFGSNEVFTPSITSTFEPVIHPAPQRSEEHTSELQSLMRISYAVFCLHKKKIDKPKE